MRYELKEAIRRDKRTQRQIAKDAGIHEVTLSRIVGGASSDYGTREKIAEALGTSVDALFVEPTETAA